MTGLSAVVATVRAMTSPVDDLAAALAGTEQLVTRIGPDEWELPTPCAGWSVRNVVNHLVGGGLLFVRVLGGEPLPPREELVAAARTDRLGDDAVGAYRTSAAALVDAFRGEGVLDRMMTVPAGTFPGIAALHLRIVEALVHGWDVARATGHPLTFPDELVEQELAFTRDTLPRLPPRPAGQGPFAPAQPVPNDAPALDRLAALLGRPLTAPA
jgi:uncharacterized protein (TIGR03086 family)